MSEIEIIGVVFSLLCVYFTLKNNIWCWPTGLVGVIAYAYVFFGVKLYSDFILQIVYIYHLLQDIHISYLNTQEHS